MKSILVFIALFVFAFATHQHELLTTISKRVITRTTGIRPLPSLGTSRLTGLPGLTGLTTSRITTGLTGLTTSRIGTGLTGLNRVYPTGNLIGTSIRTRRVTSVTTGGLPLRQFHEWLLGFISRSYYLLSITFIDGPKESSFHLNQKGGEIQLEDLVPRRWLDWEPLYKLGLGTQISLDTAPVKRRVIQHASSAGTSRVDKNYWLLLQCWFVYSLTSNRLTRPQLSVLLSTFFLNTNPSVVFLTAGKPIIHRGILKDHN